MYHKYVQNNRNANELEHAGINFLKYLKQSDRSINSTYPCPYTLTMFALSKHYKDMNPEKSLSWIMKLKPNLLCRNLNFYNGNTSMSDLEKYYSAISRAFLKMENYDSAIKSSERALNELDDFSNHSEVWFYRRIALSYTALGKYEDSIKNFEYVLKYKPEGYIYKENAENYYHLGDFENALNNLIEAVLIRESLNRYAKYDLMIKVLDKLGLVEKIDLHRDLLDAAKNGDNSKSKEIIKQLTPYWESLKYKDQIKLTGFVSSVYGNGHSGKISLLEESDLDIERIVQSLGIETKDLELDKFYYSIRDFKGKGRLNRFDSVTFYLKKGFNKKFNREEPNATNIELINL